MENYSVHELRRELHKDMGQDGTAGVLDDAFSGIRRKYEEAELNRKLEGVVFGGYSRKKVNEVIDAYRDMLNWTQENFEFQLEEVRGEIERLMNERGVLKKQLEEELGKTKEVARMEQQLKEWEEIYEELRVKYESAEKMLEESRTEDIEKLKKALEKAEQDLKEMRGRYSELRREYEEVLSSTKNNQTGTKEKQGLICQLTEQLESLSQYCIVLEEQHKELELLRAEHESYKRALQDCQKKYLETRRKNTELGEAVSNANSVVKEVMDQLVEKKEETERLKLSLKQCKQQVIDAQREKLEQQTENLEILELLYKLEQESGKGNQCQHIMEELEEITKRCTQLESDKIIYLSAPETAEKENDTIDNRAVQEIIDRARLLTGRMASLAEKNVCGIVDGETGNAEIS